MDGEQDDDSTAVDYFSRIYQSIGPGIYGVYLSPSGQIISTITDTKKDQTYCVHYPFLHEAQLPREIQTIARNEIEEIDRLGPDADLVSYPVCSNTPRTKAVFKYYFLWQYAERSWDEMNIWMRLPQHRNIVPFDRVVIDELEGRVIGFTNVYVPGGTLENTCSGPPRVFKLDWLRQLIQVVDDLNFRYGISHQDVAPRNLLVDDSTDCIMLFDFNFATRAPSHPLGVDPKFCEARNDIKGTVLTIYEIITRDSTLRDLPQEEQDLNWVYKEWVKHSDVRLDHPVSEYQQVLREWKTRREGQSMSSDKPQEEAVYWPPRPAPPTEVVRDRERNSTSMVEERIYEWRRDVLKRGGRPLNWERPPQERLRSGARLLATGDVMKCS